MFKFILATFVFLLWGFYELSGGSEFDPQAARLTNVSVDPLKPASAPEQELEIKTVALNLTAVDDVPLRRKLPIERLPQQDVVTDTAETPLQGESVKIVLPSLVANADPTPEVQPAVATTTAAAATTTTTGFTDIRTVSGSRVNVRGGPGTSFGVVTKLTRGDEVEILEDDGNGWVRLRPLNGNPEGWMADFLLSEG